MRIFAHNILFGNIAILIDRIKTNLFCFELSLTQDNTMEKKKRSGNITEEQRSLLLEFMKAHPQLVVGKFSKTFTCERGTKLWQEIGNILNACNGAEKNWKAWRKCWQDFRSRSKAKQAHINVERRKTGGGAQCCEILRPDEQEVLQMIPSSLTIGHEGVLESGMDMTFGSEDDAIECSISESGVIEFLDEDFDHEDYALPASARQTNFNTLPDDSTEDIENNNPAYTTHKMNSGQSSSRKKLSEVKESTRVIAEIAEKTYVLKEKFCNEILVCKKREAEAMERIATVAEKILSENNCMIM